MNCWWYRKGGDRARTDPGLKWLENVPGPSTWLGFQEKAPVLFAPGEDGEDIVCALAYQHGWGGYSWIDAWHLATHKNEWLESPGSATPEDPPQSGCQTNPRHNAVAAVAIGGESDGRMYYYWHEECGWFFCSYTWRELPEVQWEEPCICLHQEPVGLEVWVIPPVEVHIYNGVGQHVGPGAEGIETGIPQSSYGFGIAILRSGEEVTPLHVSIEGADLGGVYRLRLASVVDGPFDLFIEIPDRSMGVFYRVSYLAVPGRAGTEYFLPLEPGTDFGLMVDGDGDGVFEGRWAPSALETYTAPGAP